MWILSGNLNADHSHRDVWLRPDREVYAGRNSKAGLVVDLVWPTPKNISRPHLVFKAQAVRSDLLELNDQITAETPIYDLILKSVRSKDKSIEVTRTDGSKHAVMPEQELLLQSGDRFSAVDGKPDEPRDFTILWKPLVIDLDKFKPSLLDGYFKTLSNLGIRTASQTDNTEVTHYCTSAPLTYTSMSFLLAVAKARPAVSSAWIDALIQACEVSSTPPPDVQRMSNEAQSSARVERQSGADSRYWGHARLEQDFTKHWPKELDYFPRWSDNDAQSSFPQSKQWFQPPGRAQLLKHIFFVHLADRRDLSSDPLGSAIEAADGDYLAMTLPNPEDDATKLTKKWPKIRQEADSQYLQVILLVDVKDEERKGALEQIALDLEVTHVCTPQDLFGIFYHAHFDLDRFKIKEPLRVRSMAVQDSEEGTSDRQEPVSPNSSAPSSIREPSANLEKRTIPPAETSEQPATRRPLIKRATRQKEGYDPLDDFFSSAIPSTQRRKPSPAASTSRPAEASRSGSQEGDAPAPPATKAATQSSSRSSRLKKRTATETSYDFLFGEGKDEDLLDSETQRKKAKLDAIYESQERASAPPHQAPDDSNQAAQSSSTIPQKRRKEDSAEVAEARKRVKRREEEERRARELREAEKASNAEPQRTSAKDEAAARMREAEAKYLQADTTSKRKQKDQLEMSFAKEFNALKIARPALKPPHQAKGEKDAWGHIEDQEDDEDGLRAFWTETSGPGFFVRRQLPAEALRPAQPMTARLDPLLQGKWAGMPNYKKFRPKGEVGPAAPRPTRPKMQFRERVIDEPGDEEEPEEKDEQIQVPGMKRRAAAKQTQKHFLPQESDSDDNRMNLPVMRGQEKAQRAARAAQSRNRQLTSDPEDEDVLDDDDVDMAAPSTSTARDVALAKPKPRPVMVSQGSRGTKAMAIDSGSDNEVKPQQNKEEEDSDLELQGTTTQTQGRSQRLKSQSKPIVDELDSEDSDTVTFRGFGKGKKRGAGSHRR